jgi:heme exporter protein CcmD
MIELGPYADYILWAYAGVSLLVGGLIAWVAYDARRVAAKLKSLEEGGIRRRSAGPAA